MSTDPLAAASMHPLRVLALTVACLAAAHAQPPKLTTPEQVGFSRERLERLDHYIRAEIELQHKAGVVVLIARHGKVAWEKAYGRADIASGRPMRTDAIFRLFSMTKPITSVALLTFYEQGKFQLTDPLERYLPAFKDVGVYTGTDASGRMTVKPPARKITLQDVFRHTAGFA